MNQRPSPQLRGNHDGLLLCMMNIRHYYRITHGTLFLLLPTIISLVVNGSTRSNINQMVPSTGSKLVVLLKAIHSVKTLIMRRLLALSLSPLLFVRSSIFMHHCNGRSDNWMSRIPFFMAILMKRSICDSPQVLLILLALTMFVGFVDHSIV